MQVPPTIKCPGIYKYDWRYRIGFDRQLLSEVEGVISALPSIAEREILLLTFDWSRRVVSLDALVEALSSQQTSTESLYSFNEEYLLHVPTSLQEPVERKIYALKRDVDENSARRLQNLLEMAASAPYQSKDLELFKIVFGESFPILLKKCDEVTAFSRPEKIRIGADDVAGLTLGFPDYLRSIPELRQAILEVPIPDFRISLKESEFGYAEYWPRELLTNADRDQLIVYLNEQTRDRDALLSTLIHEVYPGHGLFYDLIRRLRPSFVDHGALAFVEGWATWCDWHFGPREYAAFARGSRLKALGLTRMDDPRQMIALIDQIIEENHEVDTRTERLTLTFQYPGFAASYGFGALWFEEQLTHVEFLEFFTKLSRRPWGDFFRIWSRQDFT